MSVKIFFDTEIDIITRKYYLVGSVTSVLSELYMLQVRMQEMPL